MGGLSKQKGSWKTIHGRQGCTNISSKETSKFNIGAVNFPWVVDFFFPVLLACLLLYLFQVNSLKIVKVIRHLYYSFMMELV